MRIFHCHCGNLIFFENVQCVRCSRTLAYLPEYDEMAALEPVDDFHWQALLPDTKGKQHRLCQNYTQANVCNWAVPVEDAHPLCPSCRLTRVIPDLGQPGNRDAWYALEVAKRRLVYSLLALRLPLAPKSEDERGLAFEFLAAADPQSAQAKSLLTGHAKGVITINIAEANDAERERRRLAMYEPYRTLLGHFRHEVGHYYWDRLLRDGPRLYDFRSLFGDERRDYKAALEQHYQQGPPEDWQTHYVSTYASAHPWEDWAETWAHYLHVTDTLETASECGLALRPRQSGTPAMRPEFSLHEAGRASFDRMMSDWIGVSYVLNSLGRGLGQKDVYPFVLSEKAIEKLRFVHEVCTSGCATRT